MSLRKHLHKSSIYRSGISHKKDLLLRGDFGIISCCDGVITNNQIEAARIALKRVLGRAATIWINIKPSRPVTKKSTGVRMGKGKGIFNHFVYYAKEDEILFEFRGVSMEKVRRAFVICNSKLPIPTKLVLY